jgi:type 2A phosphatase activator TIP41
MDWDEDEEDFSVVLDADGRVYGSTLREESYATTAWEGCFSVVGNDAEETHGDAFYDALKTECASVRSGQHWIGANDAPRCALERFAMRLFDFHAPDEEDGYDAETSGIEFWTQDGVSLGAHFDKDETAREKVGVIVTPHLATVTYLSDGGAPTVVFEGLTPRSLPEEKRANESCERVAVMYPKVGAHLRFDGRLLHGVLTEFADDNTPTEGKRMTLLCNVWLNHKPMGVERLPEKVSTALDAGASMEHVWKTSKLKSREISASGDDKDDCVAMRANKFGPTGGEYVVDAKLPFAKIKREAKDSKSGGVLFVRCEPFSIEAGVENEDEPDVKRAKTS